MDQDHYCREVAAVLDSRAEQIADRLQATLKRLPRETKEVTVGVHVDQDGEGFLTVRIHLSGPNLYVLNQSISETAELLGTVMTPDGFKPPLPVMSPGEDTFSVSDALADCAIQWLHSRWSLLRPPMISVPISIASMGGYGSIGQIRLSSFGT
ncbi:DUF6389 family protein [Arenimonas terrae]|uniref:Uncharacterized protein n=1 Tax=Arenimonas terrae TaxID=2546226 RepID=A0A5C4RXL8_9GAMM|nr:DUF6389 family protein [Arenimonas terrae]TNJ35784.1 hypothetical protein E1B00_08580 [Arenimonas terrae]